MDSLRKRLEEVRANLMFAKELIKEVSEDYRKMGLQASSDMVNNIGTLIEEQVSFINASLYG